MIKWARILCFMAWLLCSAIAPLLAATNTPSKLQVEVVSVTVAKPVRVEGMTPDESLYLLTGGGTIVKILITLPKGAIVGIDRTASKIVSFTDDRGGDLTQEAGNNANLIDYSQERLTIGSVTSDGHHIGVILQSHLLPTAGSTKINIVLELAVQYKAMGLKTINTTIVHVNTQARLGL